MDPAQDFERGMFMDVRQAIMDRRSVRAFTDQPVTRETLHDVLTVACRAVSGVNSQPWEFAVVTGDLLKKISEDNIELLRAGAAPDMPFCSPSVLSATIKSAVPGGMSAVSGILMRLPPSSSTPIKN